MADMFFSEPDTGVCALFDDPGGGGQWDDIDAPCNRPAKDPLNWLSHLYFHSELDPMEVAIDTGPITVNHATIPASAVPGYDASAVTGGQTYGGYTASYAVYTHDLGYIPDVLAIVDGDILSPAYPIQSAADGRCRFVSFEATTTQILVHETAMQTGNPLGAIAVDYAFLILLRPPTPSGNVLMEFEPGSGLVTLGREKFRSDGKYLQIVSGGSPFALPTGKTLDLANGTFRSVSASGVIRDIVPSTFALSLGALNAQFGPSGNYDGSFTGEPVVQVQAP
jgi:hypothetical protein